MSAGIYHEHFELVKMSTLPPDPRVRRRAAARSLSTFLIALLLSLWIGDLAAASALHWDRALAANPMAALLPPWNLLLWTVKFATVHYTDPAIDALVRHAFVQAWILTGAGVMAGWLWAHLDHQRALGDHSKLTTEKGDARWATPEEIRDAGLLPDHYDLRRGFVQGHQSPKGLQ